MKKFSFLILLISLMLLPSIGFAQIAPPVSFYGTAVINSTGLPSESTIKAYYGSASSASGEITTTAIGKYGAADPDNYNGWTDSPLTISEESAETIYFKTIVSGYNNGEEITADETNTYSDATKRQNLTFTTPTALAASVSGGTHHSSQSVSLSATAAASIYYTLDGTAPDNTDTPYDTAITINSDKTLKAIAYHSNGNGSETITEAYVFTCSVSSVSNGTVSAYSDCTITCNSGYTLSNGACVASGGGGGGGGGGGDTTAPSISNIAVSENSTSAAITWTTNESSQSWIVYGTSTAYGSEEKTTSYVTSHSITLSGLTAETTYHYQVKSKDSSGNIGTYTDKTFTTLATGEEPAEEPEAPTTEPEEPSTKPYSEMTVAELQAEVSRILAMIADLQALLLEMTGEVTIEGIPSSFTFDKNLKLGDVSIDVKYLQIVLNSASDTRLASSGVGSPGNETNYFGSLTKSAVIKFQEKYTDTCLSPWGLTSGTGFVGSTTRDK
ncbi:MAG: chitobiase/beta-hexosaminidase C-terminal domain-containing protein, partial [Deltaproteobacteria bacterium]|nr:chitobiase/beta-hexosaminidase C-terminal domain-containing protein [Deltaproteobacteria bacterium]